MEREEMARRIEDLKTWERPALVEEWTRIMGQAPPKYSSPQFMIRVISYHWQERAFGGLSNKTKKQIASLMKQYQSNPLAITPVRTQIKAGTVLRRLWQGRVYEAMVAADGFVYQGTRYKSLSEIACVITGTKWNGYAFFGLRKEEAKARRA